MSRQKKSLGNSERGLGIAHDVRDQIVDFVRRWSEATEIGAGRFVMVGREQQQVLRLARTLRPRQRAQRLGSRDFWLEDWEK